MHMNVAILTHLKSHEKGTCLLKQIILSLNQNTKELFRISSKKFFKYNNADQVMSHANTLTTINTPASGNVVALVAVKTSIPFLSTLLSG